jgi:tetratricopeptide (TPR) repeat protein
MNHSRLDQLLFYYKEDPDDPFNLYALALEYQKSDLIKAREYFDMLLGQHENYVPTYYHAAKLYQNLQQRDKAIALYEKGISIAKKHQDTKAARELQSAYQELMFE